MEIVIFVSLVLILPFWMRYANEVTFFQRQNIIHGIKSQFNCDRDFAAYMRSMGTFYGVSYDSHMTRVATFRDQMKLYKFENLNLYGER